MIVLCRTPFILSVTGFFASKYYTCAKSGRLKYMFLFAVLLITGDAVLAQDTKTSIFQHLTPKEGTKIGLEMDLTSLMSNKKSAAYTPAKLTDESGKVWELEVKLRGKYRRKVCEMPPLKLKFKKKNLSGAGLDTLNEMKLVLPCLENDLGDELIVKEYLAYKMFELTTDACVRARLIKLTLTDLHVGKKHVVFAILLEDEEEICKRLKGVSVEQYGLPTDSLLINQACLVSMFEYMIGNTDWDLSMIRNVKTIRAPDSGKIILIPYDFDFSGLVSAPYASPSSETGLRSVRERFLFSNGLPPEALKRATQRLRGLRKEMLAICRSKYLSKEASDQMVMYLDSFFTKAESVQDNMPATMAAPAE